MLDSSFLVAEETVGVGCLQEGCGVGTLDVV